MKKIFLVAVFSSVGALLWFYSAITVQPTNVAFISQFSKVFVALIGVVILGERLLYKEGLGLLLAFLGGFIITYAGNGAQLLNSLLIFASAFSYAISTILVKLYVKDVNPTSLAAGRSMIVTLILLVYALILGRLDISGITVEPFTWGLLGALTGPFLTVILYYEALKRIDISKAVAIRSTGPFFTAFYATLFFATIPNMEQMIGGSITVLGVILITLGSSSPR